MESAGVKAPHPGTSTHAPWEQLPTLLLGRCLRCWGWDGAWKDRRSALATCTSFAKAILSSSSQPLHPLLILRPTSKSSATVLRLLASWDLEVQVHFEGSYEAPPARLRPLLTLLSRQGVRLPRVEQMECERVLLDAYAPAGLAAVFPNLASLMVAECQLEEGMLPLAGCSNLKTLSLWPGAEDDRSGFLGQLQQLASLPSLNSLLIAPYGHSTSFLPLCARQLTELTLPYSEPDEEQGSAQHEDQWRSALSHAAQCTNLRKLQVGPCTVQEVATLLSSLPHLQDLDLRHGDDQRAGSTDGLASTLLQHIQLTRLSCYSLEGLQQSCTDSPCSWKQLSVERASAALLSRLPLHSLSQPLQLRRLDFCDASGTRATVADVQAAVSNLARSKAPHLGSWPEFAPIAMTHIDFGPQPGEAHDSSAALLLAAAALLSQCKCSLLIEHCTVDAELVAALQQVLGHDITYLSFTDCTMHPSCWVQLAHSLPRTTSLTVTNPSSICSAAEVMAYLWAAQERGTAAQQRPSTAQERHHVSLSYWADNYDMDDQSWADYQAAMISVAEQLQLLRGLGVRAAVDIWVR